MIKDIRIGVEASTIAIDGSNKAADEGIQLANDAAHYFEHILTEIDGMSEQICHVSAVTQEVTGGTINLCEDIEKIFEIARQSVEVVSEIVSAVAVQDQEIKEVTYASEKLEQLSKELTETIGRFTF